MNLLLRLFITATGTLVIGVALLAAAMGLAFFKNLNVSGGESRAVWIGGEPPLVIGNDIDMWRGVPVRCNGLPYSRSWGKHYADDGYYYGQKWQCVEFMKRFYHDRMKHNFPDGMGHAAEFFDKKTPHGTLNVKRGLVQYANGGDVAPAVDDIIVWTAGGFGHVAIVCRVDSNQIEIVQQNIRSGTRKQLALTVSGGKYLVEEYGRLGAPAGWLRLKK